jgi:hypothetical protein
MPQPAQTLRSAHVLIGQPLGIMPRLPRATQTWSWLAACRKYFESRQLKNTGQYLSMEHLLPKHGAKQKYGKHRH